MPNFVLQFNGPNKLNYVRPTDFAQTYNIALSTKPKKLGQVDVDNVIIREELLIRTPVAKPEGCNDCMVSYDYTKVKLEVSGSVQNETQVRNAINQMMANHYVHAATALKGYLTRDAELPIIV